MASTDIIKQREIGRLRHIRLWEKCKAEGRCRQCGNSAAFVRKEEPLCLCCWFGHIAKKYTGTRKSGPMFQAIFEAQNSRCAYTNELLIPGINASIDHKIPLSRGGNNEHSNLQWVTLRINSMKNDMTHDEFLAICLLISKQASFQLNPPTVEESLPYSQDPTRAQNSDAISSHMPSM